MCSTGPFQTKKHYKKKKKNKTGEKQNRYERHGERSEWIEKVLTTRSELLTWFESQQREEAKWMMVSTVEITSRGE